MSYDYDKMHANAKVVLKILGNNGVSAKIKRSRYQSHIKTLEVSVATTLDAILKSIGLSASQSDLTPTEEKAISGKYKAKLITIKKAVNGLKKGDTFLMLNTFTEKGTLKTKDLVPEKIGVIKKYTNTRSFDKDVRNGIKSINVQDDIKIALNELYTETVRGGAKDKIPMNDSLKAIFKKLKSQDIQAIGKDFGEILSLRWYLNQPYAKNMKSFYFSEISNEPLVDYSVVIEEKKKEIEIGISAKFEKGGAPSIKAVADNIDDVYKRPTQKEKQAIDVLKALAGLTGQRSTTSTKILNAFDALNIKSYKILEKTIGIKNPSVNDIADFVKTIAESSKTKNKRIEMFKEIFADFYDALGKKADDASLNVIFNTANFPKYHSVIVSPMGYALVTYMNNQPIFNEILNNISKQLNTQQVYLYFRSNSIEFKKKLFSEAEFTFSYGANAKNSDNTGIKFAMK